MASRKRIFNIDRNCFYDRSAIMLGMDNCAITWVEEGVSVRDTTSQERIELRAEQAKQTTLKEGKLAILGIYAEIPGTRFRKPTTTKYRVPREAYEYLEAPLGVRVCRWPRISA